MTWLRPEFQTGQEAELFNPMMYDVAKHYQNELQFKGKREQKSITALNTRYSLNRRLLVQLGDVLIVAGEKLHQHYGKALNGEANLCQPRFIER